MQIFDQAWFCRDWPEVKVILGSVCLCLMNSYLQESLFPQTGNFCVSLSHDVILICRESSEPHVKVIYPKLCLIRDISDISCL